MKLTTRQGTKVSLVLDITTKADLILITNELRKLFLSSITHDSEKVQFINRFLTKLSQLVSNPEELIAFVRSLKDTSQAFKLQAIVDSFTFAMDNFEMTQNDIILMKSFMYHYCDYLESYAQLCMLDSIFSEKFKNGYQSDFQTVRGPLIILDPILPNVGTMSTTGAYG